MRYFLLFLVYWNYEGLFLFIAYGVVYIACLLWQLEKYIY